MASFSHPASLSQAKVDFIKHFYAVSDNKEGLSEYIDCFTEDADIKFANATTPASKIPALRKAMWNQVISRKHTLKQVYESHKSDDLVIIGLVDLEYESTHAAHGIDWAALMRFEPASDPIKMSYYQVFFDPSPGKIAKERKPLITKNSSIYEGDLLILPKGKKLRVQSTGQGPALVFLHGLGGAASFYTAMVDYGKLGEGHQIVLVDSDGHGQSPFSGTITQKSLVEDVIGILDALKLEKATIIGHSVSGLVAYTVAIQHPERVERLVTIGAIGAQSDAGKQGMRQRAASARQHGMNQLGDTVPEGALSKKTRSTNRLAYNFVRALVRANNPEAYAATCEAIADVVEPQYEEIKIPTLIVTGREDALATPEHAESVGKRIDGSQIKILDHLGHWPAMESPDQVAEALKSFLDSTKSH